MELFLPEYRPPVQQLVNGGDGTLWLQRENLAGGRALWSVFDANGQAIGVVELPRGLRVAAATRAYVIGEEYDQLEVPYISRCRRTQTPPARR